VILWRIRILFVRRFAFFGMRAPFMYNDLCQIGSKVRMFGHAMPERAATK
jgi:hypothetical protein